MGEKEIISDNDLLKTQSRKSNRRPSITSCLVAVSERLAASPGLKWMTAILVPLLIFLAYPLPRGDYDLWWQMALGKYYLTHHTLVIDHSIFSWTPADSGWIYNTFLGSIILYLMYHCLGGFGLWLFQWLIFLGIFLSFYLFLRSTGQRLDVTALTVIAAIGITCSMVCSFYKPELFSALLFSWTVFIFFSVKVTRRKHLFYCYPVLFAFWVNLHGAFILALIFLALIFTGEILNRIIFPRESFTSDELIHFGIAYFFSLAVTLLNPYGITYHWSIYHGLTSEIYELNSKYISAYVSLWPYLKSVRSLFVLQGQVAWLFFLMMMILGCIFLFDFIKKKSCDFALLFIFLATSWGSMRGMRGGYLLSFTFFFMFVYWIHRFHWKTLTGKATLISLIIFFFLFINVANQNIRYGAYNRWFGAGLDESVPVAEVAFLKKYKLEGPIFNDYLLGGYLIWALYPDYKVFIDPRLVPYHKQVAPDYWQLERMLPTPEDMRRFNQRYPFKTAIIHYNRHFLIEDFLKAGWKLVYFEKNAAVLVHESMLAAVPPEVQWVDLGPSRFRNVKDPVVLLNVFNIYVNVYPEASRVIYDIYRSNVSTWYEPREQHLRAMEEDMRKMQSLQRKAKS